MKKKTSLFIQKWVAKGSLYLLTATSVSAPVFMFIYWLMYHGIGVAVVGTVILSIGLIFSGLPLAKKISRFHTRIQEKSDKLLPPHIYDENVKFWEFGDRLKIVDGDGLAEKKFFLGFNDKGEVIVADKLKGISVTELRENKYVDENLAGVDSLLLGVEKFRIQDLNDYKNPTCKKRLKEMNKKKILSELDRSQYNEKLKDLAELEKRKFKELRKIRNTEEEELSFEELNNNQKSREIT